MTLLCLLRDKRRVCSAGKGQGLCRIARNTRGKKASVLPKP